MPANIHPSSPSQLDLCGQRRDREAEQPTPSQWDWAHTGAGNHRGKGKILRRARREFLHTKVKPGALQGKGSRAGTRSPRWAGVEGAVLCWGELQDQPEPPCARGHLSEGDRRVTGRSAQLSPHPPAPWQTAAPAQISPLPPPQHPGEGAGWVY